MTPALLLAPAELTELVAKAVAQALVEHDGRPALLDRSGLAKALTCSTTHVDALRRAGLPTIWLGDAPRFELSEVLSWIRSQNRDS